MKINLTKIFFAPPNRLFERIVLFIMLVVCFAIFFRPLQFTEISPIEAVILAIMPSISLSWGWIVLMRYLFRRGDFLIK